MYLISYVLFTFYRKICVSICIKLLLETPIFEPLKIISVKNVFQVTRIDSFTISSVPGDVLLQIKSIK